MDEKQKKWWQKFLNFHFLFLAVLLILGLFLILRLKNLGVSVGEDDINKVDFSEGRETYDVIFPLTDEDGNMLANKAPHTILFFGNSPLADDRDSENNVVNMIARQTGSTVYNCSVADSLLAAHGIAPQSTASGQDVYNFYWLCIYLTMREDKPDYFDWLESAPDAKVLPETKYLRSTLETIDMNTVDTIAIMYDGSDYLAGSPFYNVEYENDTLTFVGNLAAGLEILQAKYPTIRIIVMSPTYAFGVKEDGSYVSSDLKKYEDGEILSSYVLKECEIAAQHNASFIDNLYGTFDEDEALDYLEDNVHLNQKGRELLVRRFIDALTRFDEK